MNGWELRRAKGTGGRDVGKKIREQNKNGNVISTNEEQKKLMK